jgi:hypothetical protein
LGERMLSSSTPNVAAKLEEIFVDANIAHSGRGNRSARLVRDTVYLD